ncbi:endonuclease/exonuclease/phosphatase family protein [Saccharicrinis sp. GN24d3]|uniref:endonuclease/exonuclease/phosphatase family protein n=1 Tax=Saccharicrinis sp. GN24d3 TaxID=3458416 RepID=UPI0040361B32
MHYSSLTPETAKKLKLLIERIEECHIPSSMLDESINVATWNIREFGKKSRSEDGIVFIAQILYQFDLIAITEVREDLSDFKRVLKYLGGDWKYVVSDWQNDGGGNYERTLFLYDQRMVHFTGLAAEAQPNRKKMGDEYISQQSWWRSPYMASFRAGSFDFIILALHARWGSNNGRLKELAGFSEWISSRWDDKSDVVIDDDLIVVGDFNTPRIGDKYYKALTEKSRLKMPRSLSTIKDTAVSAGNKRYDQILHRSTDNYSFSFSDHGGVIDFARDGLLEKLFPDVKPSKRTYELSDHLPMWIQIYTNNELQRLDSIIRNRSS